MKKDERTKKFKKEKNANGSDREALRDSKSGKSAGRYNKEKRSPTNDSSWYANNPQLLADAASVAFGVPTGTTFNLLPNSIGIGSGVSRFTNNSVPGICAIKLHPTIGVSNSNTSAVNIAARDIYSFVRHANSGHSNYDPSDLMMYLLAMDNICSLYGYMCRAYSSAMQYSVSNRYYAKAMLEAQGFNSENIIGNLAEMRYQINQFAMKISALAVPAVMPLYLRHMFIYTGIYTDAPTEKHQLYLFKPEGFYVFKETFRKGSSLKFEPLASRLTYPVIKKLLNDSLDHLLESEDIGIMCGDIRKAYGDNLFRVNSISEDFRIVPTYDEKVLSQIQNLRTLKLATDTSDVIYQIVEEGNPNVGAIIFDPKFVSTTPLTMRHILTLRKDSPAPEDVIEATRLTPSFDTESYDEVNIENHYSGHATTLPAEFATGFDVYWYEADSVDGTTALQVAELTSDMNFRGDTVAGLFGSLYNMGEMLCVLEKFDYHPAVTVTSEWTGAESVGLLKEQSAIGTFVDIDNYAIVGSTELNKMHDTAMFALFGVPQMK